MDSGQADPYQLFGNNMEQTNFWVTEYIPQVNH